ncbi:MAG: aspartate carbamoyltransferase [Bacillota bacterium]|jgi:aspartate carbamoyltransferase catalytic subunit
MSIQGKSLIAPDDFSLEELQQVIELGKQMAADRGAYQDICQGKILATLFYEPSTRTRLSFESAMLRMGGQVLGFADADSSSVAKGESIADTIRVVSSFADVAVLRHPREGAALLASQYSTIPIINGGDGGHQHPTQTLTDLLTISTLKGSLDDNVFAFCGDLKYGRTVHSLIRALARYQPRKIILVSPEELVLPTSLKQQLVRHSQVEFEEALYLEDVISEVDVLYMTRIQRERFFNEADYLRLKNSYVLDARKMELAKPDMIVMHPLPRVNEIAYEVDRDPRAVYFRQAELGVFARMALMALQLGVI